MGFRNLQENLKNIISEFCTKPKHPENLSISFREGPWNQKLFWKNLETLPITNMNRALACHALNMLALCYLPGCIAGYIQLYRGTKYSRFPKILDRWLKMRKYLGLLMPFSACIHVRLLTCRFLSVL